jgi:hypothetical protein
VAFGLSGIASAHGQNPPLRRGLWFGAGLGLAQVTATCSVCFPGVTRPTGHLKVGGTLSRRILVGVEGTGWRYDGPTDRRFLLAAGTVTFYPVEAVGLHLKGAIGQSWYTEEDAAVELSTQGLALGLGLGYDIRVAPGVSLTPFGGLASSGFTNPSRTDKATGFRQPLFSDLTLKAYQVGLTVTIH